MDMPDSVLDTQRDLDSVCGLSCTCWDCLGDSVGTLAAGLAYGR